MKLELKSFEERIETIRSENVERCKRQSEAQKMIDSFRFKKWLVEHEKAEVKIEVDDSYFDPGVIVHVSNVTIDEFIENILGPLHIKYNILWRMKIEGDEKDPTFVFVPTKIDYYSLKFKFRVKEGEFTQCKVVKRVKGYTEPSQPQPIYTMLMECK